MPVFTIITSPIRVKPMTTNTGAKVGFFSRVKVEIDDTINPPYLTFIEIEDLTVATSHASTGIVRSFHIMFDTSYDQYEIIRVISMYPKLFYSVFLQPRLGAFTPRLEKLGIPLPVTSHYPAMPDATNNSAVWDRVSGNLTNDITAMQTVTPPQPDPTKPPIQVSPCGIGICTINPDDGTGRSAMLDFSLNFGVHIENPDPG